jgi:hypothetical protein
LGIIYLANPSSGVANDISSVELGDDAALAALHTGDIATACNKLQDLLNEVNAQRGKKIPLQLADALTSSVIEIRAELGCTQLACSYLGNSDGKLFAFDPKSTQVPRLLLMTLPGDDAQLHSASQFAALLVWH